MDASLWQDTLDGFQQGVAADRPTPAGVATAAVTAALGLSLLVKALRITGKKPELLEPALKLIEELRSAADADVAAVRRYIETKDQGSLHDAPVRAAKAAMAGVTLCEDAAGAVKGLIRADIEASTALLQGAAAAIAACVAANAEAPAK
ncbi:MAG: cyclodeaminase/cyclohydrolase family protein [Acidobacteriota bacterium]